MVIAPNSTIILYSGMPLDDTYSDTLYFATKSNRDGFFSNVNNPYRKMVLEQNTYQRVNSGVFEAKVLADEVYDVNYMAFQNTNFGNKWFYAFVESVEYINNLNTRISYKIDVIQTYLFDCDFEDCLVEREHSQYDTLFENYLPEPLSLGEYEFEWYQKIVTQWEDDYQEGGQTIEGRNIRDCDIVVQYVETNGIASSGFIRYKTYMGCNFRAFNGKLADAANNVNNFISQNIQKPEMIVNMYMCPSFLSKGTANGADLWTGQEEEIDISLTMPIGTLFREIDDYIVRNKKLFTYPYSYLHIDDSDSNSLALRFEYFADYDGTTLPKVRIFGTPIAPIQVILLPLNYKGTPINANQDEKFTEKLTIASYPLCSWNYDTYKAWLAQNTVPMVIKSVLGVADIATGVVTKGVGGGAFIDRGENALMGMALDWYSASIKADTMRGDIMGGNALYGLEKLGFNYARAHQPVELLRIYDDFFDMYGYTTNRVKKPNISSRPHWNYVKTRGAKLIGACPIDSLREMCDIFDKGITFWKNANEVGNYSLDNRPVALPNP